MTNQNIERERAILRIRKLREQTIDRGASENEANMAMQKIGELLDTFDLTLDDVSLEAEICKLVKIDTGRKNQNSMSKLVVPLAKFCDVVVYRGSSSTVTYCFYGLEQDVDMAQYLYEIIDMALGNEMNNFKNTDVYKNYEGHRREMSNSFEKGFIYRINRRLEELKEERQVKAEQEQQRPFSQTGTSLVVAKDKKVKDDLKKNYGVTVKYVYRQSRGASSNSGYNHGQKAGNKVGLNRPVGQNGGQRLIGGY